MNFKKRRNKIIFLFFLIGFFGIISAFSTFSSDNNRAGDQRNSNKILEFRDETNLRTASTEMKGWVNATVISDGYGGIWDWNNDSSTLSDIAVDSSGIVHVVWQDDTDGIWGNDIEIMYANYSASTGWSNATVISDGFAGSYWNDFASVDPAIAVDGTGTVHVVWQDDTNGIWGIDIEIMYANYSASTGWSNATVISDGFAGSYWNTGGSWQPDIAVDGTGTLHVSWVDNTNGPWRDLGWGVFDLEIMYANYSASTGWSNATVISDGFAGSYWNNFISWYPSIAVDDAGNVHVVWSEATSGIWGTDWEILYVNYSASTGWSNVTVISDGFGGIWGWNDGASQYPAIALDDVGNIYVVWQDDTNGTWGIDVEIMCANFSASTGWSNATVISDGFEESYWNDGESTRPAITVNNEGNVYVVWQDDTNGTWGIDVEIIYANYSVSTGWSNITVISDGFEDIWGWNNDDSNIPAIAMDRWDNIHVSWQDDTNGTWGTDIEIMYTIADLTAPRITIGTPSDSSSFMNTMDIDINATIIELETSVLSAKAIINASTPLELSMQFLANNWTCIWDNISLYDAGDYNITIWAKDQGGNINQSVFVIITITDIIAPSITIEIPSYGSSFEPPIDTEIEINTTITDLGSFVSSAKAMINASTTSNAFNLTMQFIANNWTCTWDNISLSDYTAGDYNITIWAIDDKGNINQTQFVVIELIKDLEPPIINFLSPENESTVTGPFNITVEIIDASAPLTGKVIATIYNNTITPFNLTMVRIGATNQWTVKWENLTSAYNLGEYYINITAIDGSYYQNMNSTGYLNITYVEPGGPIPTGDDDDDDEEEFNILTFFTDSITEFFTDLITNPLNIFLKPTNLMILGTISGILIGIILVIRKIRKGYKTSKKKIMRIQEIIED